MAARAGKEEEDEPPLDLMCTRDAGSGPRDGSRR
jgi:hypothetical protein